jgi:periplasmic divalent cation tolerance protein
MTDAPDPPSDAVVCLVTAPQGNARALAVTMIERQLAACVNIVGQVQSIFRWEGSVQDEQEALLLVKTTRAAVSRLEELLGEIHPYDTFELVALDVVAGSHPYLQWIASSVGPVR